MCETKLVKLTFNTARAQIKKCLSPEPKAKEETKKEPETPAKETPVKKTPLTLSNDPLQEVEVFCNICDEAVLMSGLRPHLARNHATTLSRYTEQYGSPRRQLVRVVHHECGLCHKLVLLAATDLARHLRGHQLGYSAYAAKYMEKGSGLLQSSSPSSTQQKKSLSPQISSPSSPSQQSETKTILLSNRSKPAAIPTITLDEEEQSSGVKIQCKVCFKTFKVNKQLSAHMKRH